MSLTRSSFSLRPAGIVAASPGRPLERPLVPTMAKIEANTSASQNETFDLCKRKWAFFKVWGVKEREHQHFVFGHALHAVADRYLTGKITNWEELFPAATDTTPAWNKGLSEYESNQIRTMATRAVELGVWQATPGSLVEFALAFLTGPSFVDARGLPLLAKAETYYDDKGIRRVAQLTALYDGSPLPSGWNTYPPYVGFIDHMILHETPPTIADHKTAKHRGYASTPAKLAENLQVLSYAAVPLVLRPDVDLVKLRHNVLLKNEDAATPVFPVDAVAPLEKVRATWHHIFTNTLEMQTIRQIAPKVVDASNPYARANNWQKVKSAIEEGKAKESCSKYGGCAFRDICFGRATAEQVLRRMDSPDPMELVKRTEAKPEPTFTLQARAGPSSRPLQKPVFGLRPTPVQNTLIPPSHTSPEPSMPFAPKPLVLNQDVYVVDPEDAAVQYRARVVELAGENAKLALYPNPDLLPDFTTLGRRYFITIPGDIPREAALMLPNPTAKVKGYQEMQHVAGITDGLEWTVVQVASTPTVAATVKVNRPERDNAFGLKVPGASEHVGPHATSPVQGPPVTMGVPTGAIVTPEGPKAVTTGPMTTTGTITPQTVGTAPAAQPSGPPLASAEPIHARASFAPAPARIPLPPGTPEWALKGIPDGTALIVKTTTDSFWGRYSGKRAYVNASSPGDLPGSTNFAVTIDELPFPDVNAHRFEGPAVVEPPITVGVGPVPAIPTIDITNMPVQQRAAALKGQVVTVRLHSTESVFNCTLEDVTTSGLVFLAGQMTPSWEDVKSVEPMGKIPGAAPTKEEKAALKEQAKAEKAAARLAAAPAQQAVPGTEAVPSIEPANALQSAIEAVAAVLNGGKVTRKALEGIAPLLEAAKQHQDNLEGEFSANAAGLAAGIVVSPGAAGSPASLGLLRVAIDHAISTLADARAKIDA